MWYTRNECLKIAFYYCVRMAAGTFYYLRELKTIMQIGVGRTFFAVVQAVQGIGCPAISASVWSVITRNIRFTRLIRITMVLQ